jgi:hypothetical protein
MSDEDKEIITAEGTSVPATALRAEEAGLRRRGETTDHTGH